ncbi:hypothetical protein [Nocardia fluminea]|uniref:hypothetical protein n=1 Tax=Nocardia fluminea TaxID=134984 RepID=UPI003661B196
MFTNSNSACIAAELHKVFINSPHAADSVELWLAVAAEAERQLGVHIPAPLVPWVPIFVRYRLWRTEGEFFPFTGSTRITTGPLTGTTYTDLDHAAHAVVGATPIALPHYARHGDVADLAQVRRPVPSWRFRARAVPPLIA